MSTGGPDIRQTMQDLERQGVAFQRYDGLPQDDHGVWAAPSGEGSRERFMDGAHHRQRALPAVFDVVSASQEGT